MGLDVEEGMLNYTNYALCRWPGAGGGGVIMNVWVVATLALMTCTRDGHDHRINETPLGGTR
jgi:hypothetical protein